MVWSPDTVLASVGCCAARPGRAHLIDQPALLRRAALDGDVLRLTQCIKLQRKQPDGGLDAADTVLRPLPSNRLRP